LAVGRIPCTPVATRPRAISCIVGSRSTEGTPSAYIVIAVFALDRCSRIAKAADPEVCASRVCRFNETDCSCWLHSTCRWRHASCQSFGCFKCGALSTTCSHRDLLAVGRIPCTPVATRPRAISCIVGSRSTEGTPSAYIVIAVFALDQCSRIAKAGDPEVRSCPDYGVG
jgi:hypothetical protein